MKYLFVDITKIKFREIGYASFKKINFPYCNNNLKKCFYLANVANVKLQKSLYWKKNTKM
jgi:hypothetical protein